MGTHGLIIYRYHKRYYPRYQQTDSSPDSLGVDFVSGIPKGPEAYQDWLTKQRIIYADREIQYKAYIESIRSTEIDFTHTDDDAYCEKQHNLKPEWLGRWPPSYLSPINKLGIEWIYTICLDRETFTINNGAHYRLESMPHIDWRAALIQYGHRACLVLPGADPNVEAVGLSETLSGHISHNSGQPFDSIRKVVRPKGLSAVHWRIRHGLLARYSCFHIWSEALRDYLSALLLQWNTSDTAFRELAYAILCMTVGGKYCKAFLDPDLDKEDPLKLMEGAYKLAPLVSIYWFRHVLVFLTVQLDRATAINEEVSRVEAYCKEFYPRRTIDAIIFSIEYYVLVRVAPARPSTLVQHSEVLPLINIEDHSSRHPAERYTVACLARLLKSKTEASAGCDAAHIDTLSEDASEQLRAGRVTSPTANRNTFEAFCSLGLFFETASLPFLNSRHPASLPVEICERIVSHIHDAATRDACQYVSPEFYTICQEQYLFSESSHIILTPNNTYAQDDRELTSLLSAAWNIRDKTGRASRVRFAVPGREDIAGHSYRIAIRNDYGKEALLPELIIQLQGCDV